MFDTSWPATSPIRLDRLPASKELAEDTTRVARRSHRFRVRFGASPISRAVRSRSRAVFVRRCRQKSRRHPRGRGSRRQGPYVTAIDHTIADRARVARGRFASNRSRRRPVGPRPPRHPRRKPQRSCHRRLSITRAATSVRIPRAAYCGHTAARFSRASRVAEEDLRSRRVGLAEPVSISPFGIPPPVRTPAGGLGEGRPFRPFDGRSPRKPWPAPPRWPIMVAVGERR